MTFTAATPGNPAIRFLWTRGFPSQSYDGFGFKFIVSILVTVQAAAKAQRIENLQLAIGFALNLFDDIPRIRRLREPS